MNIFEVLIMQPIFNILAAIYAFLPGHDFGISLIIFTVLVRLAMWPLVKKQLHQTRLMRKVQPELKKIKARTKGNKQLETKLMMELYRERGVKPFSSIGLLLLQLPIFIALYQVIRVITEHRDQIHTFSYGFVASLGPIKELIAQPNHFNEKLFGIMNLTQPAISAKGVYIPAILLALVAAFFQFIQSRQLAPKPDSNKKLRDILKSSATGEKVDQGEISAIMTSRMTLFMPVFLLFVAVYLPSALVLYYATSSIVAVIQQHAVLSRDEKELVSLADKKTPKTSQRESAAQEAEIITPTKNTKPKRKKRKRR